MKICNKAKECQCQVKNCDHHKAHSSSNVECDPKYCLPWRKKYGMPEHGCYYFSDSKCEEI